MADLANLHNKQGIKLRAYTEGNQSTALLVAGHLRGAQQQQTEDKAMELDLRHGSDAENSRHDSADIVNFGATKANCFWCQKEFKLRTSGGKPQRFCTKAHRETYFSACRKYTDNLVRQGKLTIELLKASQTTSTFVGSLLTSVPVLHPPQLHQECCTAQNER